VPLIRVCEFAYLLVKKRKVRETLDPRNPFDNPLNRIKTWSNLNPDGTASQVNQKIVNPDAGSDYGSHRWADINRQREGINWGNERPGKPSG